ncbi:MAG TPA: creatininase family protein [Candidatus Limnocylindria bacterium]|nr:creatininase family protein [Candidatus Limnocylindria bacterium]
MRDALDVSRMTGPEYAARVREAPGVLLPLASQEILGDHGPLGADWLVAGRVAPRVAQRTGCLHAPAIPYGDTLELSGWVGTVHVPGAVLEGLYEAVARSFLERGGAKAVVFLAFHSLNLRAADAVCRRLACEGRRVFAVDWWRAAGQCAAGLLTDTEHGRGHGSEMAASVLMALGEIPEGTPLPAGEEPMEGLRRVTRHQFSQGPFQAYGTFREYCRSGAWGSLQGASADKGREILDAAVELIAKGITEGLA